MAKMGNVWDRTTAFAGERVGALAVLALAGFVVPGAIGTCLQVIAAATAPPGQLALMVPVLVLSLASIWGSLAVIELAIAERSAGEAARMALRRLLPALLVSVVLGLLGALLFVPLPLLLVARGYDLAAIAAGQAANALIDRQTSAIALLYMLVLVPVLLLAFTRLVLVSAVVLREGMLFGAVPRSWTLTRRHGWRIFGILLLFGVIGGIAQLAAQAVFGSVFALLFGTGPGLTGALIATAIVTASVQAAVMVLLAAFQGKLYAALAVDPMVAA